MRYLLCLFLLACASPQLTEQGKKVSLQPPRYGGCQALGEIKAAGINTDGTTVDALNKAGELGGNYLDLDIPFATLTKFVAKGKVYKCKGY